MTCCTLIITIGDIWEFLNFLALSIVATSTNLNVSCNFSATNRRVVKRGEEQVGKFFFQVVFMVFFLTQNI